MVEDRCEYRVPARSRRTPLELGWAEPRERPGRARHGRRDEKIILTKEPVEPAIKLVAEQHRTGHLRPGCREPGFDLHGDVGIDVPGILAVTLAVQRGEAGKLQRHERLFGRAFGPDRIRFFDVGARSLEASDGATHALRNG